MADYYTNFSFLVVLADPAQRDYALHRFLQMSAIRQGEDIPPDFPAQLIEAGEDCCFKADADGSHAIWLHSHSGGVDGVCAFVQHLVQKFNLNPVSFEWSHDCSKPRTDAYGGGAAYITAQDIQTLSTAAWLRQQAEPQPVESAS